MLKDDGYFVSNSPLYKNNQSLFDTHINRLFQFSRSFDSDLYLKVINTHKNREILRNIQDGQKNITYIIEDLWPKLGFLPVDANNPDTALIAEYFLNALVFSS